MTATLHCVAARVLGLVLAVAALSAACAPEHWPA